MRGFRDFVLRGNIVDLAVAVVIGVAFSRLITVFTESLISPLIGLVGGRPSLAALVLPIGSARLRFGAFLTELISFVITAAVVYFVFVLPMQRLLRRMRPAEKSADPHKECLECLSSIPAAATRCAYCTVTQVRPAPS